MQKHLHDTGHIMTEFQPQDLVTGHFDRAANVYGDWYDLPDFNGHSFRIRRQRCLDLLSELPAGAKVVDAGAGPATFVEDLLNRGFEVTATDIAPSMVEEGRKRYGNRALFEVASAEALPLKDNSQDAVTAMGLMEYLNNEPRVLNEFFRVLKPNGLLVVTYPNYYSPARAWDRVTHWLAKPIIGLLGKRHAVSGVKHREYAVETASIMIEAAGFDVADAVFYNFKLAFRPLDSLIPKPFVFLASKLERFCRTPCLRNLGTGFIILARKRS